MIQNDETSELVKGTSIWLLPDEQTTADLQRVIKCYSQLCLSPEFPPHVTLLGQLELESEIVEKRAQSLARQIRPLHIHLGPVGMEETFFRSLYLAVSPDDRLQRVFKKAWDEVLQLPLTKRYFPHLSLLYSHFDRTAKEDLLKASRFHLEQDAVLNRICLMRTTGPPDEWQLISEHPLK